MKNLRKRKKLEFPELLSSLKFVFATVAMKQLCTDFAIYLQNVVHLKKVQFFHRALFCRKMRKIWVFLAKFVNSNLSK